MILIDAHGPDHGLKIEVTSRHCVVVEQWGECCEPDEHGSYSPHIQHVEVLLRDLLDSSAPHYSGAGASHKSMHDKVKDLALAYLGYWGGEERYVSDEDRPCQHFCMNYSGIGPRRAEPWPEHMKCPSCGGEPE